MCQHAAMGHRLGTARQEAVGFVQTSQIDGGPAHICDAAGCMQILYSLIRARACVLFLIGGPGCGKTALMKQLVAMATADSAFRAGVMASAHAGKVYPAGAPADNVKYAGGVSTRNVQPRLRPMCYMPWRKCRHVYPSCRSSSSSGPLHARHGSLGRPRRRCLLHARMSWPWTPYNHPAKTWASCG